MKRRVVLLGVYRKSTVMRVDNLDRMKQGLELHTDYRRWYDAMTFVHVTGLEYEE